MPIPRILSDPTLSRAPKIDDDMMIFQNRTKPSLLVEIVAEGAELRLGEIRWPVVVYRRIDSGMIYVRPRAEFDAKFAPVSEK